MAQNIYDDERFFSGYSQLRRSVEGLDGAPEWPALRAMLPNLRGADVVDLGCGFGWFCRWAANEGARSVLGIDLSERMLERAATEGGATITYRRADLETLQLQAASFDLVYSSLAFHYIADLPRLFATIYAALRPGGSLVFSMEHPIFMAPNEPGWQVEADGRKRWPIDNYANEGPRTTNWLADGVVKHHRMLGTILTALIDAGFTLRGVAEFAPTDAQLAARPELLEERERPMFVLIAAVR